MGKLSLLFLSSIFGTLLLTGCPEGGGHPGQEMSGEESGTIVRAVPPRDPRTFACDPFMDSLNVGSSQVHSGIVGSLFYREADQPRYYSAQDYIDFATPVVGLDLFFSHLNIPTRPFDRGFVTASGETLLSAQGDHVYEFFGVQLESGLITGPNKTPGQYQLAVLSDDGAVVEIDNGLGWQELINNDGDHPTRMKCANSNVFLNPDNPLPIRIKYYQGPRRHISLVVLYRYAGEGFVADPLCDQQGNDLFFDSRQDPVVATDSYLQLMTRGWSVVPPEAYVLPTSDVDDGNPCQQPDYPLPTVESIRIVSLLKTEIALSFKTSVPTKSKLVVKELVSGKTWEAALNMDPLDEFRTVFDHTLNGLVANTMYEIITVSEDEWGRVVIGAPLTVRTRR